MPNTTLHKNLTGDDLHDPKTHNHDSRYYTEAEVDALLANKQPLDATLTALSGLNSDAGLLKQTGADAFTKITDNSSNWNTAYGWGDHSAQNYFDKDTDTATTINALLRDGSNADTDIDIDDYNFSTTGKISADNFVTGTAIGQIGNLAVFGVDGAQVAGGSGWAGIVEIAADSTYKMPSDLNIGISCDIVFDAAVTYNGIAEIAITAFNRSEGNIPDGNSRNYAGLWGAISSAVGLSTGKGKVSFYGLKFDVTNNASFTATKSYPVGNGVIAYYGVDVGSSLGAAGYEISGGDSQGINRAGRFIASMRGDYSGGTAGENYSVIAKTVDSLTDGDQDLTSYAVYIDACASNADIGSGGALTSWALYEANGVDSAFAGNVRFGGTTAPTVPVDVTGAVTASTTITGEQITSTDDITMQGHLLTLGNNSSAADVVISFLSSGNDGSITYDQTDDEWDFTGGITVDGNISLVGTDRLIAPANVDDEFGKDLYVKGGTGNVSVGGDLFLVGGDGYNASGNVYLLIEDAVAATGSIFVGSLTNYIEIKRNGDMSFAGTAGFYPVRLAQSAIPTPDTGELVIWRDTDDGKVYLVYNDTDSGVKSVEMT